MRKYAIGAVLLDKEDPSKLLGRTPNPLLSAADEDREGYVPNVVYTCGAIRVGDDLFLPYGVADSSVCFVFMPIADLLAAKIGRAHVWTPVTNANRVCSLLLYKHKIEI